MIAVDYSNEEQMGFLRAAPESEDDRLKTAVVLSLFTWRRDVLDDVPQNGWWGEFVDGPFGSRLWKLLRAKRLSQTLREAESYTLEALRWLERGKVVRTLTVSARWVGDTCLLTVSMSLPAGGDVVVEIPFDL